MYGLFEVKQVDWRALYSQYRSQVSASTTDNELFAIFSQMLGQLNDGHVWLLKPGPDHKRFDSGISYADDDFSLSVAKSYLESVKEVRTGEGVKIVYGRLPGNIGYVYLEDLGQQPDFYEKSMDDVLSFLEDTKGIIVDARSIEGGEDRSAQHVAGRFASERKLFMTSRFRNGPAHTDFTSPLVWHVEPAGKSQYTRPVILLTTRITGSAGESFTLAMRENANVQHWGDTTYGAFSDNPRRELPNGWIYTISVGDFRAADGKSYEGIGIAPERVVTNSKEDIESGKDKVLETAMASF
jgi:C-terminal processing protease CtpA/Prc